jgi:glycine/D-amino acid oxidase-like deaminating enzyme
MATFTEKNLWRDSAQNINSYTALEQDIDVDVVIIGGGFSGLSAALRLAENKHSVAVLEAHDIGYGGSGRNVGLVNAGLWLKPDEITQHMGQQYGERLIHFLGNAPQQVFNIIEKYGIDCEARHNGTLHCADSEKARNELFQRQQQWSKYGVSLDLLSQNETERLTGTDKFCAALHDKRAGTIQPFSYACGLAQNASALGASIFCNSPVLSVSRQGSNWLVKTASGSVTAQKIISATGTYGHNTADYEVPKTTALYFFQMATEPLSDALQKEILPEKHGAWDTQQVLSSFRMNDEGRMIIGSIGNLDNASYAVHRAWASRKLGQLYPQLKGASFTHEWYGRIGLTNNNIPRLAQPHPDWLSIWGYNGRGIGPGTVFGRLLADLLMSGSGDVELPLPYSKLQAENFIGLQSFAIEFGATAYHVGKARF